MCTLLQKLGLAFLLSACPAPAPAAHPVDPPTLAALLPRPLAFPGEAAAITALIADPADPALIWAGGPAGGVWRSTNAGATFSLVLDAHVPGSVGALALDPSSPQVVWAGTGEGYPRDGGREGAGLFRSRDGGASWEHMGLASSGGVSRIVVHPHDPGVVWVAVIGPTWSDSSVRGVFRTRDGGITWQHVLSAGPRAGASDLLLDPKDPTRLVAGVWDFRRGPGSFAPHGPGSGIYVSQDGGESWQKAGPEHGVPAGELGHVALAAAPSDPRIVYAWIAGARGVLLRSGDGGIAWRQLHPTAPWPTQADHRTQLVVDPRDPERIYLVGAGVRTSPDGGVTFHDLDVPAGVSYHALWIDAADPRRLLLGSGAGVWESRDRGGVWRSLGAVGPAGTVRRVSVDHGTPYGVHEALVDPREPDFGYVSEPGGVLRRITLGTGESRNVLPWAPDGVNLRFGDWPPLALDPFDPGTLYVGSQLVHRSHDRGESWQILSRDLTANQPAGRDGYATLTAIGLSPLEREVIWTGSDDGRVHLARAGGGTWEELTPRLRGVPRGAWVSQIHVSRHASGTTYVVLDDVRRGNREPLLLRTENHGRDWRNLAQRSGLEGVLHTILEDPVAPELLFVGGEGGLFVSMNRGASWFRWTRGLPAVPVVSLAMHPQLHDLVIGTEGRGSWLLEDVRALRELALNPSLAVEPLYLFPPSDAVLPRTPHTAARLLPGQRNAPGEATTTGGGALLTYWVGTEGAGSAVVTVVDGEGRTIRTFPGPALPGLNRTVWDLTEELLLPEDGEGSLTFTVPHVLPGSYAVRVAVGGITVEGSLSVREVPGWEVPLSDRIEKLSALRHLVLLEAHLESAEAAAREVADHLRSVRLHASGGGHEGRPAVAAAADSLLAALVRVSDASGVLRHRRGVSSLGESFGRPTEGERVELFRLEAGVRTLTQRLNAFFQGELASFRDRLVQAGVEPFPDPGMLRFPPEAP